MNRKDFDSLVGLLDQNAGFVRPQGQTTGFSLQEEEERATANVVTNTTAAPADKAPAAIPLPSTVVDQQLHLPVPSHSKAAQEKRANETVAARPRGNEIWTQAELEAICRAGARAGPPVLAAAAAARAGATTHLNAQAAVTTTATAKGKPERVAGASEPQYTVLYQQNVRAEDVFLGVDFTRDESSASSDGVVVKVEMPLTSSQAATVLHVEPYELTLSTPEYYLCAPLPRKVVAGAANAQWDKEAKVLTIRLVGDTTDDGVKMI